MTTTEQLRVAIVTGGGSGLGRAFVRELADANFAVAALGRRKAPLTDTIAGLADKRVAAIVTDVTDERSVDAAFDTVVRRWGRIDVLVNNAGVLGPEGELDDVSLDEIRETLEINILGAVICARAAMRVMKSQHPAGGRIINNGSVSAHVPRPHTAAYAIGKHALTGLTRSLALDGRPHRIAAGQIDLGNASTAMTSFTANALQADGTRRAEANFDALDAARAVRYMATLPLEANVLTLTLTASGMPYVGRG